MATPSVSWSENSPAGGDQINAGDNRIREMKTQIREVVGVDHDFPSSGSAADVGQHLRCTFQEQADLGSGAVGTTILGSQTVNGKGELVYTDEDDNDVQITDNGKINAESIDGVYPCSTLAKAVNILPYVYPVGTIYTSVVATNPATVFGFGTWVAFGAGKVLVGLDAGQTEFDTVEETGGAKTHTLTEAEMPAHTHTYNNSLGTAPNGRGDTGNSLNTGIATGSTGGGTAHNNLQPYIVVYFFKRTA